jgi:large subunit ribosomal protein L28
MAKVCQLLGKCAKSGHKVSHSQIKSKRKFRPNLQTKRIVNPATGLTMKLTLSTTAIKTIKKWQAAGKKFDLRKLIK